MWVDASNYTGELTDEGCADLKAAGVVGVIVQAITGLDGRAYAAQQLAACRRNGLRVQGYLWAFPRSTRMGILSRLAMFDGSGIEALWVDVEEADLTEADVDQALAVCDEYMGGSKTGLYSGRWFFAQQGWINTTRWSDRPLWDSRYDNVAEVTTGFRPYGGWLRSTVKQYMGTSAIGAVHQIDLDVMS